MSHVISIHKKSSNIFCNPFYIQGLIWTITVILYKQGWSRLYPPLSTELGIFFLLTILISFILGYSCQKQDYFCFYPLKNIEVNFNIIKKAIKILYIVFSLELIIGGIPLLSYILGGNVLYTEFGLPFLHVIVVIGFSTICIYSFYSYISIHNKKIRKKNLKNIMLCISPFLIMFNRGALLTCVAAMGLTYLMSCKKIIKKFIPACICSLAILWVFGYLGDLRTDIDNNHHLILDIGQSTDEFRDSPVPKEFFWSYLYFTSPLSNCQYTINNLEEPEFTLSNFFKLMLFAITPEIISKRIGSMYEIDANGGLLIIDALNVSPYLNYGYIYLGWFGMTIMFIFSCFFIIVTTSLVKKQSPFYVPTIVSINVIIIMNVFSNMFIFMGLIPIPLTFVILSHLKNKAKL